jgi:hypothetical protein
MKGAGNVLGAGREYVAIVPRALTQVTENFWSRIQTTRNQIIAITQEFI